MKKLLLSLSLLLSVFVGKTQIVINEYSCSNYNSYADAFGNFESWVELYNAGAVTVDLAGYYLSDKPSNIQNWQIPIGATTIAPGARKMVFASGANLVTGGGEIHPNFKLTQTHGNWIILANAAGIVVDSLQCKLTQLGHSRGRTTDGAATWGIFINPTPNASNGTQTAYTAYATKPIFNIGPGNYVAAQNISISSPDPGVTIYYTTNGTPPVTTSTTFTVPIAVPATVAIRARAFSSNPSILPSFIETNTYFINDAVDPRYDVISLCGPFTTASANNGAYLFHGAATPAWSSLEFFDNNFTQQFEQEILATKHGNDSWAYSQKGMDIEAFDETGTKAEFAGAFWGTTPKDTFSRFILKAGASDNWPLGPGNSCHLRDVFAQTLAEKYNLDMDFRRFRPSIVFINGEYWGVYDMRERVDKEYFKYYYNKSKTKVDHLSYWGGLTIRMGSDTGWVNLYNYIMANPMSVQANYDHVKQYLDVKSFIQYFIFNEYLVNHDWLNWNTMWWRGRGNSNPVKWRYALWDEDAICGLNNPNYTGVGTTGPTNDPCEPTSLFQNNSNIKHTDMLTKLFNNPEFTQTFKDNWIDMLNGPFECQNILAHFDSVVNVFSPEMNRQAIRWGGTLANWNTNVAAMRTWITSRCGFIAAALDTCLDLNPQLLKLNVSPPNSGNIRMDNVLKSPYVWSKTIAGDSIYTLKATPTAGQYWAFDHWEKQEPLNTINPNVTTDLVQYNFKKKDSVIAFFKYFNYDSVDVTFDVNPPGTGTITLNGNVIPTYPTTIKLDRRLTYNLIETPIVSYKFITWQKNNPNTFIAPSLTDKAVTLNYMDQEVVVANFEYVPPPPPPPPLPTLTEVNTTIFIPNAFSPNNDGHNDLFVIEVGKDATGIDVVLFDRWGNQVYHTNKLTAAWDGRYKGRDAEMGTYNYIIKVKFRNDKILTYKGDLTLLR